MQSARPGCAYAASLTESSGNGKRGEGRRATGFRRVGPPRRPSGEEGDGPRDHAGVPEEAVVSEAAGPHELRVRPREGDLDAVAQRDPNVPPVVEDEKGHVGGGRLT